MDLSRLLQGRNDKKISHELYNAKQEKTFHINTQEVEDEKLTNSTTKPVTPSVQDMEAKCEELKTKLSLLTEKLEIKKLEETKKKEIEEISSTLTSLETAELHRIIPIVKRPTPLSANDISPDRSHFIQCISPYPNENTTLLNVQTEKILSITNEQDKETLRNELPKQNKIILSVAPRPLWPTFGFPSSYLEPNKGNITNNSLLSRQWVSMTSPHPTKSSSIEPKSSSMDVKLKQNSIIKSNKKIPRMESTSIPGMNDAQVISPLLAKFLERKSQPQKRKGKWTPCEERYTLEIINAFMDGILELERGTTLRAYLAASLDCDPMRITKKLSSQEIYGQKVEKKIGKSTFNPRRCMGEEVLQHRNVLDEKKKEFWTSMGCPPPNIEALLFATDAMMTKTNKKEKKRPYVHTTVTKKRKINHTKPQLSISSSKIVDQKQQHKTMFQDVDCISAILMNLRHEKTALNNNPNTTGAQTA